MHSTKTIGIIAAVSPDGVIGRAGAIPWRYSGDLRRFKRLTLGSTVIMGRVTWESLGRRPLPGRTNFVVGQQACPEATVFPSLDDAIGAAADGAVWLIGGRRIYEEGMRVACLLDITHVPDAIPVAGSVLFPTIDPTRWQSQGTTPHEDEPALTVERFVSRVGVG